MFALNEELEIEVVPCEEAASKAIPPPLLVALLLTTIVLKNNTNFLSLVSLFYYANLVVNIIFSAIMKNKNLFTKEKW